MKIFSAIKHRTKKLIYFTVVHLIKLGKIDTKSLFYSNNGILKWKGEETGEKWFLQSVLSHIVSDIKRPVFLDIGANVGDYTCDLVNSIPNCHVYCLEPNPLTFQILQANLASHSSNISLINMGAASDQKELKLYTYSNDSSSGHASLYLEVFQDLHKSKDLQVIDCILDSVDNLIEAKVIPESQIHFIKIDTEGHELEALKGALKTISDKSVRAIQIEFNEMNIISRVFLKDFYDLLYPRFSFFRLDSKRLIFLGSYSPTNEIFVFQNIVAIREDVLAALPADL